MARRRKTSQLDPWRKSATFREVARQSAKANLREFEAAPRCGAKRKRDGKPCAKPAMKNGRCALHGGKTPKGRNWHIVQYPDCSTAAGEAKFQRKLRRQEMYAAKRAARLAAMTPEQQAVHDAWHRTHRPGLTEAARRANRDRMRQDRAVRALLAVKPSPSTSGPELAGVQVALAVARARLALLEAKASKSVDDDDTGIFS